MNEMPTTKRYAAQVVLWLGLFLAWPLWREFKEPAQPACNTFLGAFLLVVVVGAFLGVRHLQKGLVEVGEARFGADQRVRRNVR